MKMMFNYFVLLFVFSRIHAQDALLNDLVINEILFNPEKNGFDYIECYNKSTKQIHLNTLMIGNGAASRQVTKDSSSINAHSFFVITADKEWLAMRYKLPSIILVCQLSSLPSFPDDEGTVVLYRKSDSIEIDKVSYSSKWHFQMIQRQEGVALERISPDFTSQDKNNWTSASASSGYGTPGFTNSQYRDNVRAVDDVSVLPKVFTPDNDGQNDFVQLSIYASEPGRVAHAIVYNASGRQVKYLVKNELLGVNNRFTWDGYDDRSKKLQMGIYIIAVQVFDTKGNVQRFKNCIVIGNLKT